MIFTPAINVIRRRGVGYTVPHIKGTDWNEGLHVTQDSFGNVYLSGTIDCNQYSGIYVGTQYDPDGGAGAFAGAHFRPYIYRFNDAGLDAAFGTGGITTIEDYRIAGGGGSEVVDWEGISIVVLASGKILQSFIYFTNPGWSYGVARFNFDGTLDHTFGNYGLKIISPVGADYWSQCWVGLRSDGEIFLAVTELLSGSGRITIAALIHNGTLDQAWGSAGSSTVQPSGDDWCASLAMQGDNIIVGGRSTTGSGNFQWIMARFLGADGSLDTTFGASGFTYLDFPFGPSLGAFLDGTILFQGDGKIVAIGSAPYNATPNYCIASARFSADGILDTSYGTTGLSVHASGILDSDGVGNASASFFDGTKIVSFGLSYATGSSFHTPVQQILAVRRNSNGSIDTSFGASGFLSIAPFDLDLGQNQVCYSAQLHPSGTYLFSGHIWAGVNHGAGHAPGARTFIARLADEKFDPDFGSGDILVSSPATIACSVTTDAASSVGQTTATANATINPNGFKTDWTFQYGLASGLYHYKVPVQVVGQGVSPVAVTAALSGLVSGFTYYGRAVGWSAGGVTFGDEVSFTTSTGTNSIIFQDTFTDTNGTELVRHSPDINLVGQQWEVTDAGASPVWTPTQGLIQSNKLLLSNSPGLAFASIDIGRGNGFIYSVTGISTSGQDIETFFRLKDINNFWTVYLDAGNFVIAERVAAFATTRASTPFPIADATPYTIEVTMTGTTVTATVNGGNTISYNSAGSLVGETKIALLNNVGTFDDFTVKVTA